MLQRLFEVFFDIYSSGRRKKLLVIDKFNAEMNLLKNLNFGCDEMQYEEEKSVNLRKSLLQDLQNMVYVFVQVFLSPHKRFLVISSMK